MGKKYLNTKKGSLEQSILEVWKQAADVQETNKNDKMDDDGSDTTNKKLDAVQPKALKKKFKDRKDTDIDNDGDTDSTDKYLHKRRKAISKNIDEAELDEGTFIMTPKQAQVLLDTHADELRDKPRLSQLTFSPKELQDLVKKHKDLKDLFSKTAMKKGASYDTQKVAALAKTGRKKGKYKTIGPDGKIEEVEIDEAVRQVDEYITKEGIRRKVKGGDGRRVEAKKEDVDLEKNAEEYTQNAHFKIQSMADALRKVWSVEEDWRKKGPAAYDKKKEVHVPGHEEDDDDEKEKNDKKVKTETGKKAAKVEIDPEITEKK